ncbi:WSC domain-containing protein 1-like [Paramacrobiotus metropolitanus]|uniref:WSC domain-containing protein 1-like n=1 Tax=Paramacrobiotus metropolitanus TaxID=2943436 RepID=UPI002446599E|nr:WSC domain-containing protein 1-like [Paramacrobiotus metropolitanus]
MHVYFAAVKTEAAKSFCIFLATIFWVSLVCFLNNKEVYPKGRFCRPANFHHRCLPLLSETVILGQKEDKGYFGPNKLYLIDATEAACGTSVRYNGTISLPTIALLSSPGSGNTWLRWLIERLTGICTGSVYSDPTVKRAGFQCEDSQVRQGAIVYKTHSLQLLNATALILLIRNPFHAIPAEFHRLLTRNQTGHTTFDSFATKRFRNTIREWMWSWVDNSLGALRTAERLLVIFYEDLLPPGKLEHQLHRIAEFLHVRTNHNRIRCVMKNSQGPVKRRHDAVTSTGTSLTKIFPDNELTVISVITKSVKETFWRAGISNFPNYDDLGNIK